MTDHQKLLGGLLLYLQIRDWAFEKMKTQRRGSPLIDIEVHQYLYLSNALATVDLIGESFYGRGFRTPAYQTDFERSIVAEFERRTGTTSSIPSREAYAYVRELRNSVIHRGLESATAGEANDDFVFALCPSSVSDLGGNNIYRCPWKYMVELASACNTAFNSIVNSELEKHQFFDLTKLPIASASEALNLIDGNNAMPDWAKTMARESLAKLDYTKLVEQIATSRFADLKSRLGAS